MDSQNATGWLGALRLFFSILREYRDVATWLIVAVASASLALGTPELAVGGRRFMRERHGLLEIGWTAVQAYIARTNVFKGMQDEITSLGDKITGLHNRIDAQDETISWQTRVLVVIASVLNVDVKTLLPKPDVLGKEAIPRDSLVSDEPTMVSSQAVVAQPAVVAVPAPSVRTGQASVPKSSKDPLPSTRGKRVDERPDPALKSR